MDKTKEEKIIEIKENFEKNGKTILENIIKNLLFLEVGTIKAINEMEKLIEEGEENERK